MRDLVLETIGWDLDRVSGGLTRDNALQAVYQRIRRRYPYREFAPSGNQVVNSASGRGGFTLYNPGSDGEVRRWVARFSNGGLRQVSTKHVRWITGDTE